jgi:chitosanase
MRSHFLSSVSLASFVTSILACTLLSSASIAEAKGRGIRAASLSAAQRLRADRLINVFENGVLDNQYDYIANLKDGRGYTAGRAGFCTGCGDLLQVVEDYTTKEPSNALAKYLPELRRLKSAGSDSVAGLKGFVTAWRNAASDQVFRDTQDREMDIMYFVPAVDYAKSMNWQSSLALVVLYEAGIQHGYDDDPDGIPAMLQEAIAKAARSGRKDESTVLHDFLNIRRAHLVYSTAAETRAEWHESVGRADTMLDIFASGNFNFIGPLNVEPFGESFVIP